MNFRASKYDLMIKIREHRHSLTFINSNLLR
jgi:hypothetical protein